MKDRLNRVLAATCVAVSLGLAGCGGDSSTSSIAPPAGPSGGSPPEEIHGIATPSSVAVVTATNAN